MGDPSSVARKSKISSPLKSAVTVVVYWSIQADSAKRPVALTAQVIQIDKDGVLMNVIEALLCFTAIYPLARAWRASRGSTIVHALNWSVAAWLAWLAAMLLPSAGAAALRYVAL